LSRSSETTVSVEGDTNTQLTCCFILLAKYLCRSSPEGVWISSSWWCKCYNVDKTKSIL